MVLRFKKLWAKYLSLYRPRSLHQPPNCCHSDPAISLLWLATTTRAVESKATAHTNVSTATITGKVDGCLSHSCAGSMVNSRICQQLHNDLWNQKNRFNPWIANWQTKVRCCLIQNIRQELLLQPKQEISVKVSRGLRSKLEKDCKHH
ncbi:hypothetical protein O6H91_13G023600 [Diphasiastrum complanatum]|uniref:Uncharacterized protein n=1 Tax=Diphasiastrum complanatum TaxID=34168 RepID=A0ACC2BT01_DIPCM|nr:hypothetical protein O6H91_13G023600 [Diphasiastrum complanatum]